MNLTLNIFTLLLVLVHAGFVVYALWRRGQSQNRLGLNWLLAALLLATLTSAAQWLPANPDGVGRDAFIWLGLIGLVVTFGSQIIHDLRPTDSRLAQRWIIGAGGWLLLFLLTALTGGFAGWLLWATTGIPLAGVVAVLGLLLTGAVLLGVALLQYYRSAMPEQSNRAAFWVITLLIAWLGLILLGSGRPTIMLSGDLLLLVALANGIYAHTHYRLLDVRAGLLAGMRTLALATVTWSLAFGAFYFTDRLNLADNNASAALIAAVALLLAVLLIPVRKVIEQVYRFVKERGRVTLNEAISHYNQQVSLAATLEDVVNITVDSLNDILRLQRTGLIIVSSVPEQPNMIGLVVLERDDTLDAPSHQGSFAKDSLLFGLLAQSRLPFGQYDIEYSPALQALGEAEHAFFREIGFSAYAPVIAERRLIGILAGGRKLDGSAYSRDDAEMLMLIAQQVGTALRSARLISDLQVLNDNMRVLNKSLENTKLELQKLDTIKTDFITIASHELRTPLAQIRGYTDIIDSLNQQGNLKQDQTAQMVANLRRSTERMEELISAMLDVSQIDVNSMDLRFVQTTPETIIKFTLDSLREALTQRNQTLETKDLGELPHLQADMQRMVQAFRNVLVNAIKFTPDGGRIVIKGALEPAQDGGVDHIVFAVQDTGVGIAQKDIEYIFQKFYRGFNTQLHSTGLYKFMGAGPGLGLTIAKGIIEGHGGRIWAESPGHDMERMPGTTFYIRVPVVPPEGARRVMPFEGETDNMLVSSAQAS